MPFNIKSLRKEHGLTQQVLANALGVTQQSVHKYENNYIEPDIEALMTLADIFDTSMFSPPNTISLLIVVFFIITPLNLIY